MKIIKTSYCGLINFKFLNYYIFLYGWINFIRYHGNLIFINLFDKTNSIQIILKKNFINNYIFNNIKPQSCILVKGFLIKRCYNFYNFFIKTGYLELFCTNLYIFNFIYKIPFTINNFFTLEYVRLKNRVFDLRSNFMHINLNLKHKITKYFRNFFNKEFFIEIETPYLTLSTSEGARDYIIPSRFKKNSFFALPQSPQIFKQLLMISIFDKYYQIVKCFRDEDLRSNRQPEFTQLDCEITFYDYIDIIYLFKKLITFIFIKILNNKINFFISSYNKIFKKFLNDKPDLRFKIEFLIFLNLNKFFFFENNFNFLFIKINNGFNLFGNNFKNYKFFLKKFVLNKINFFLILKLIYYNLYNFNFNFILNFNKKIFFEIFSFFNINFYDLFINIINFNDKIKIFLKYFIINISFSYFGKKNNLINFKFFFIWVIKFPLIFFDIKFSKYKFLHNPFGLLIFLDIIYLDFCPLKCHSKSYDLIINENELGGGSIRNFKSYLQKKIFFILNFDLINFEFFFNSLKLSSPLHLGIALGLDRFLMILIGVNNIKDLIAFPKTQNNNCLLTNSPNILYN